MSGGGAGEMARKITKEEVIEKLKDDGDFDRLRLKIIRRLKENEGLRNSIISVVKQSTALNRPGAQNMKPRQLSDVIFDEVGSQALSQLSDSLWGIIRSEDGMKNEITETVQSIYNQLSNPGGAQEGKGGSSNQDAAHPQSRNGNHAPACVTAGKENGSHSDNEPDEPPGFRLPNIHHNNGNNVNQHQELIQPKVEEKKTAGSHAGADVQTADQRDEDSDEDPEIPPGFG